MLFSYAVRAIYIESCSMFVRGGVYKVVHEAMGGTLAKFSVSALMFDYVLTGPITGVSAGLYLGGLINEIGEAMHMPGVHVNARYFAAVFAAIVTLYFWRQNIIGIHESSEKALRIMQITTVMVVILITWCLVTIFKNGYQPVPLPVRANLKFGPDALGWLKGTVAPSITIIAIMVGLGHSLLAMSGFETLAQVYREIAHPKLKNLERAGWVIFAYSMLFTSMVSFFAVMIIPDAARQNFLDNLIGGLSMYLVGPTPLKLLFHGFVVLVGTLILAGAVNTAIIGSNGVLNRVAEDGVLPDWFRHPHQTFGTDLPPHEHGGRHAAADHRDQPRRYENARRGLCIRRRLELLHEGAHGARSRASSSREIGNGKCRSISTSAKSKCRWVYDDYGVAVWPRRHQRIHQGSRHHLRTSLHRHLLRRVRGQRPLQPQRKLARAGNREVPARYALREVTKETIHLRPGNVLVAVRNPNRLQHLERIFARPTRARWISWFCRSARWHRRHRAKTAWSRTRCFPTPRPTSSLNVVNLAEKAGKHVELMVVLGTDPYEAAVQTAARLQSSRIVMGLSPKLTPSEQGAQVGHYWEELPEPRPSISLELVLENQKDTVFLNLGPHPPRLWPEDIELAHRLWLELGAAGPGAKFHHRDVLSVRAAPHVRRMAVTPRPRSAGRHPSGKPLRQPPERVRGTALRSCRCVTKASWRIFAKRQAGGLSTSLCQYEVAELHMEPGDP